jgi:uncharacterized protein (TIGR02099 family)
MSRWAVLAGRLRTLVLTAFSVLIIAVAVVVGVGRALLPHADGLRPWLEQQMSQRVGETVHIGRLEARWPRLTPNLTLHGLRLGDDEAKGLEIDAARLEFRLPNLFDGDLNVVRLIIVGPEAILAPDDSGRWGIEMAAGIVTRGRMGTARLPTGDVLVRDARLSIRPRVGPSLVLAVPEGGISRAGDQTLFYGQIQPDRQASESSDIRFLLHHPAGQWQAAQGWLKVDDLVLGQLMPQAAASAELKETRADLEGWLDWSSSTEEVRIDLDFKLRADLTGPSLAGQATAVRDAQSLQLHLDQLITGGTSIVSRLGIGRAGSRWAVAADRIDLGAAHAALDPWASSFLPHWPSALSGVAEALELALDSSGGFSKARGRVEDLAFLYPDAGLELDGLDLALGRLGDRLSLAPSGVPAIRWPAVLDGLIELDQVGGRVLVARNSLQLEALSINGPVAAATADGWLHFDAPKPFMDLLIQVDRVGPVDPRPYLPHRIIPPPAMRWLDQALVRVDQAQGYVNLHMRAGTRVRNLQPGSYQAEIAFSGLNLDYWPEWPAARALEGEAQFIGRAFSGTLKSGRVGLTDLAATDFRIDDLANPALQVDFSTNNVAAANLQSTLAAIPFDGWRGVLAPMEWSGPLTLTASLGLPFRRMRDWSLNGSLGLEGASLFLPALRARLDELTGRIRFDKGGIDQTTLNGLLAEEPIELEVDAGFGDNSWLELSGAFNPAGLVPQSEPFTALRQSIAGRSDWFYRLDQPAETDGIRMHLKSNMEGLSLALPAPLGKPESAIWPLDAELIFIDDRFDLDLRLDQRLQASVTVSDGYWSSDLSLGLRTLSLPSPTGLTLAGEIDALDVDAWAAILRPLSTGRAGDLSLTQRASVVLQAQRFEIAGISTGAGVLSVEHTDAGLGLEIETPEVSGSIQMPQLADAGRAVVADFSRLHLSSDVDAAVVREMQERQPDILVSDFSPAGLPAVSVVIEDFRRGAFALGRLRLEAHPVPDGLEVELLDIDGPDLRLQGTGRWVDSGQGPQARFSGRISTPSLTEMMGAAGYDPGIEARRAQIDLDVQWPGAPTDFALSRLSGSLDLSVGDGQIPEARPGAGRFLGLVSFNAIPRRLMLDFRDVFSPGMRFDDIRGRFALKGGRAQTDGLTLQSPAATMTIVGETDMVDRQYDQILRVEPGLGASLPVIGGLAGGPVGAAAGLVLQQLLDRPLREVTEVSYRITGPWESPEIELFDAQVAESKSNQSTADSN